MVRKGSVGSAKRTQASDDSRHLCYVGRRFVSRRGRHLYVPTGNPCSNSTLGFTQLGTRANTNRPPSAHYRYDIWAFSSVLNIPLHSPIRGQKDLVARFYGAESFG